MAMQSESNRIFTPEEYLAMERRAEYKSEYVDGVIFAMSGASIPHNVIVANLIASLLPLMRGRGCQIYPSDLKVRSGSRFFYPDVSAICGEPRFNDGEKDVVLNPSLIIEVLSPSTQSYDKLSKMITYQKIPTLQEYLLVHQDQAMIQQYRRQSENAWMYTHTEGEDWRLEILGCQINKADVYSGVRFSVAES